MDFALTPAQVELQAKARDIADRLLRPKARERDLAEAYPIDEARALAEAGLMGVVIDTAYGGLGLGPIEVALALREIAAGCAATAVTMAVTNMVADMIQLFGTPSQKDRFLPGLQRGERPIGAFMLSEPHSGSDAADLRTRAVADGDEYVIDGAKMWATSGAIASVALVMARTDPNDKNRGITAFLVDPAAPGYIAAKAEDKMGLRASNTAAVTLEGCRVPADAILGGLGGGFGVAMTALDGGRIGIGAQALGIARSAHEAAVRHLVATGRPRTQADEKRIADAAVALDSAWLMVLRAAWLRAQGRRITREAAMAKVYATEAAGRVVEWALETMGPAGLSADGDIERHLRDVRVTRIYEGTSEIQRLVIARELLRGL